jgi:hypothetical protein
MQIETVKHEHEGRDRSQTVISAEIPLLFTNIGGSFEYVRIVYGLNRVYALKSAFSGANEVKSWLD